jgi:glycosyltransferase involved in cell wall biosynthesis
MYALSDLYVMPSVSEPFGISPLEAMVYDVPVIVSRNAGVSEVLSHALKVDFWDVEDMAGKILAVLNYPALSRAMLRNGRKELKAIRWDVAAERIMSVYNRLQA